MFIGLILYNLIGGFLFFLGFPLLILYNLGRGKYGSRWMEYLGRYPLHLRTPKDAPQKRPIWVHAVSVGEIKAAVTLIRKLKERLPHVPVLVSTTTPAGRETAETLLGDETPVVYFPLDFWPAVKRALRFFRPRGFVVLETELWPNFLYLSSRGGARLILVNGRISERSFSRYKKAAFFWGPLLHRFEVLLVRDEEDGERFKALGADPAKVRVFGNIKYDGLAGQAQENLPVFWRRTLAIEEGAPVWVAGSTRSGEEAVLLDVYQELKVLFPDLILILAPRHLARIPQVEGLLKGRGMAYQLLGSLLASGERRKEEVILVDRMGDLFGLYSLATVVFCGGSLVPKGGQNILEAAAWGKVVFYGPHLEDFKDARRLLEKAGAGFTVENGKELKEKILHLLNHPEERTQRGRAGQRALQGYLGLTERAAEVIAERMK